MARRSRAIVAWPQCDSTRRARPRSTSPFGPGGSTRAEPSRDGIVSPARRHGLRVDLLGDMANPGPGTSTGRRHRRQEWVRKPPGPTQDRSGEEHAVRHHGRVATRSRRPSLGSRVPRERAVHEPASPGIRADRHAHPEPRMRRADGHETMVRRAFVDTLSGGSAPGRSGMVPDARFLGRRPSESDRGVRAVCALGARRTPCGDPSLQSTATVPGDGAVPRVPAFGRHKSP